MQRSKSLALSFLLGALLVGGALGFTADRVMTHGTDCAAGGNQGAMRAYIAKRLHLSPAQRVAVDSILDKRHHDFLILVTPIRPQLDSIKSAARGEIAKLLTPDQLPRYKELMDESKREEEASRK